MAADADEGPLYWARFAQAWTCLGFLHHRPEEPWPASTRRATLHDLASGIDDWVTDAALNAMVVGAWADPGIRADVRDTVGGRFLDLIGEPGAHPAPLVESVAMLTLVTPGMVPDVVELAQLVVQGS